MGQVVRSIGAIAFLMMIFCSLPAAGAVNPADVDFNGDLTIDGLDLLSFSAAWMSHDGPSDDWNGACDISEPPDGVIDIQDLASLTTDWGVTIPEPNAFVNVADINSDYVIGVQDVFIFSAAWLGNDGPTANWNPACDIADPPDGIINAKDFAVLSSQWLAIIPDPNDFADVPDINSDRAVDLSDYAILSAAWLSDDNPPLNWNRHCDVAELKDGLINIRDFAVLAKNWEFAIPDPNLFAYIPGGEFEMGAHLDVLSFAKPVHAVKLNAFYMSRFQMTNQRYCDFLNSAMSVNEIKVEGNIVYAADDPNNSYPFCDTYQSNNHSQIDYTGGLFSVRLKDGTTDMTNHPLVQVNWYGAAAYCNWKSIREGRTPCYDPSTWQCDFTKRGYRLPTEAEWEYAARGGLAGKRYPWGDTIDGSMANFQNSGDPFETGTQSWTTPVGYYDGNQIPAGVDMVNGYGLYDMAGNVYEWCYDWFGENYYQECYDLGTVTNPTGPDAGTQRVLRGGSWNVEAGTKVCQLDYRESNHDPLQRSGSYGFRICIPAP